MSYRPRYDKGDWNAICDSCGKHVKASELRKRWDGLMVCSRDWEPRQPQDFVRGIADFQAPPFTRPESSDSFIAILYTRSFADSVSISDITYGNNNKYLNLTPYISDNSINAITLNGSGINTSPSGTTPGSSDGVSFTETLVFGDLEAQVEALSISENVTTALVSALALNGTSLNSYGLN